MFDDLHKAIVAGVFFLYLKRFSTVDIKCLSRYSAGQGLLYTTTPDRRNRDLIRETKTRIKPQNSSLI